MSHNPKGAGYCKPTKKFLMSGRGKQEKLSPGKRVRIFLDCVEELKARPFVLEGLPNFKFRIFQKNDGKIGCEFKEGDKEQFRSFLMTFRKFLLNEEPANIDSILNTCRKFVKPEQTELKKVLEEFKTIWSYQYRIGTILMTCGKLSLTPEYVLDLWLNGQYFHSREPQKSEQLSSLLNKDVPLVRLQLSWSLPSLTRIILRLGGLLNKALSEGAFCFPEDA